MIVSFHYPADTVMGELERLRYEVKEILALLNKKSSTDEVEQT